MTIKSKKNENFNKQTKLFWVLFLLLPFIPVIIAYLKKTEFFFVDSKEAEKIEIDKNRNSVEKAAEELEKSLDHQGANHIKKACIYAYDARSINEIISGQRFYEGKKIAFLTFDDGPNNTITPQILDILKKKGVPATFFVIGNQVDKGNQEVCGVIKEMYAEGHGIALHSYSHNYRKLYPGKLGNTAVILDELKQSLIALRDVLGKDFKTKVFRYPGGSMSWKGLNSVDLVLEKVGIDRIDWNALTGDAQPWRQPASIKGQMKYLKNSIEKNKNPNIVVVLCHDAEIKSITVRALPTIINYLKDKGYSFGILK